MSETMALLACVGWLVLASLSGLALAWRPSRGLARTVLGIHALFGAALVAMWAWFGAEATLDGGVALLGGHLLADHLGAVIDALAAGAVLLLAARLFRRTGSNAVSDVQAHRMAMPVIGAAVAATGVALAAHASDLVSAWLGLELAAYAAQAYGQQGAPNQAPRHARGLGQRRATGRLAMALGALGLVLLFGATADLSFTGLSGRVAKVFNHWGGVQRYVYTLEEGGAALPAGFVAQAKGRVVTGMAGASLLLPGVMALCAALMLRLLDRRSFVHMAVFARLAAFTLLARLFVGVLHAPRLVNEPYGWAGPIIALALVWAAFALSRASRARSLRELGSELAQINLGFALVLLVASANFYGHRALANRPVAPTLELRWAQYVGDQALAAALAFVVSASLACALLVVLDRKRLGLHDLQGAGRRHPGWGLAIVSVLGWLAGAPLTPGFVVHFDAMQALLAHSELRAVLAGCVALWIMAVVIVGRVAWVIFAPVPVAGASRGDAGASGPPEAELRRRVVSIGVVAWVVAFGLWPQVAVDRFEIATAGLSQGTVSEARARWVTELRARRARGEQGLRVDAPIEKAPADP